MKPIKQTRGKPHKKTNVTAAIVKKENSINMNHLQKRSKLSSVESHIATINNTIVTFIASIMDPLNYPNTTERRSIA